MIMLMRGLVLFVKGDWAEFAHSLGFPTWSHKTWPCIFCFASLLQLSTIQGFNPMEFPFELFDKAKYEDACDLCEILVTIITEAMKKQIASLLVFDKRKKLELPMVEHWFPMFPRWVFLVAIAWSPHKPYSI